MSFFSIINLLGGLALFLYGMSVLSNNLEKASEGRLEQVLEKLTDSVPKGVLLGALVTAAIQSSSATTVVVVGLVNAKILKLRQAIGVIMGANIGTTITAHILRLTDLESSNFFLTLIKPTTLAPLMAVIGVILFMSSKRERKKDVGLMLLGFGILFTGMFQMEAAVRPLSSSPFFAELFATMQNPIIGVLVGALVTAIIQSSSASVGILQALSSTGSITYSAAFPIIMGQNIGTCITPILASIGASKNAKRSALVHLIFNIGGTCIFLVATYAFQYFVGFSFWDAPIDKGGIANFHTVFNVSVTLLLIPFVSLIEKMAYRFIKKDNNEDGISNILGNLDERLFVSPGLAVEHARTTVYHMVDLTAQNFELARELVLSGYDPKIAELMKQNEMNVDTLQDKIEDYIIKLSKRSLTEKNSADVSELLHMIGEFERIADQCENIMEATQMLYNTRGETGFSAHARQEMENFITAVGEIFVLTGNAYKHNDPVMAHRIEPLEQVIDIIEEQLKLRHIERLRDGRCSVDTAFSFVETLSCLERIADHCSNIGVYIITIQEGHKDFDTHAYLHTLHKGETEAYAQQYAHYEKKYLIPLTDDK